MPNTDGHIHLEKQLKKGIWEEYKGDFEYRGRKHLSYDGFCKMWRESFPHVRIRAYKQVSGQILLLFSCHDVLILQILFITPLDIRCFVF
jgi:hypothetical protein